MNLAFLGTGSVNKSLRKAISTVGGGQSGSYGVKSITAPIRHTGLDGIEPVRDRPKLVGHRPLREVSAVAPRAGGQRKVLLAGP